VSEEHPTRSELRGSAWWITLDRPETRNALSAPLVASLLADLRRGMSEPRARAIVLTGAGTAFCAGADLKNRGDMGGAGGRNPLVEVLKLMRDGDKPVVAAVNGHAFGGGLGLVAAADIALAAESAQMSFSEVRIGLIPAMISVVVVPKLGPHQALRLFLTGERFDARRALEYGLVHRVVSDAELASAAESEVHAIALGGPLAVREAKRLVRTVSRLPEDEAFAFAERKIAELFASEEAAEGMRAFAERRPPRWAPPGDGGGSR
jgi:methylglutaconyl-CoA hydratase